MLAGLTRVELRELQRSVGIHRGVRDLTPVEIADRYVVALKAGASKAECAQETQLADPTMVDRFLKLLDLPSRLKHLVEWGKSGKGVIGFSGAVELTQFPRESRETMGLKIVEHELTKKEIISVRQLLERSSDSLPRCLERVLRRRPVVKHVEVVLGSIGETDLQIILQEYSQRQRNDILRAALDEIAPGVSVTSARLGTSSFSVVGPRGVVARLDEHSDPEGLIQDVVRRHVKGRPLGERVEDARNARG